MARRRMAIGRISPSSRQMGTDTYQSWSAVSSVTQTGEGDLESLPRNRHDTPIEPGALDWQELQKVSLEHF